MYIVYTKKFWGRKKMDLEDSYAIMEILKMNLFVSYIFPLWCLQDFLICAIHWLKNFVSQNCHIIYTVFYSIWNLVKPYTYNNAFVVHRIINIKFISWLINVPALLYIFDWNSSLQDCNNFTIPLHMLVMQSQAGSPSQSNSSKYL